MPICQRRVPLAVLVSPATKERLRAILAHADGEWSLGGILDEAVALAGEDLMAEAGGRQIVVITLSPQTERNLGLSPLTRALILHGQGKRRRNQQARSHPWCVVHQQHGYFRSMIVHTRATRLAAGKCQGEIGMRSPTMACGGCRYRIKVMVHILAPTSLRKMIRVGNSS